MKSILLILNLIYSSVWLYAQVSTDFTRMKCAGPIPSDFTTTFKEKYTLDFDQQRANLQRGDAKEFAVMANYYNHNLLQSGSVLYGDPISTYCNKVLDRLLKEDEELRSEVRVYTIKSNHLNAYSTSDGIIFVTLGLIARVQNEAQLAYVLAHEIGHYHKKHVFKAFVDQKEIWSNSGSYRNMEWEERTLTTFQHSRDAELEADIEGLTLYLNAGYPPNEIDTSYDVLLNGYLPIAQKPYDFTLLEDDSFRIPNSFFIDAVDDIMADENVDDTRHTHPNVKTRKETAQKRISDYNDEATEKKIFWVGSKQEYDGIQRLARFEMVNTFIRNNNYMEALYHIQVLQVKDSGYVFLQKAEMMCWAGIQKFINNRQKKAYSTGYRDLQGELQAVFYFASKMSKKGINALAVRRIWDIAEDLDSDAYVNTLKEQCVLDLPRAGYKRSFFRQTYPRPTREGGTTRKPKKYDFVRIAFVELFKDTSFSRLYGEAFNNWNDLQNQGGDEVLFTSEEVVADADVRGVNSYYGLSGVDRMLYLSPKFFRLDFRKEQDAMFLASEIQQRDLEKRTSDLARRAGVDLVNINQSSKNGYTTEEFNDFMLLSDWLREETNYNGRDFYSFTTPYLDELRDVYQTDYLGFNNVWHFTDRKEFSLVTALVSALYVIPLPFYLYWQFKPEQHMDYLFAVFDLKNGEMEFVDSKSFSSRYRKDLINSHLFNSFNQLRR
ncbi:MAG: M48 family metallopeptidase [Bacteroidia bacterium]|nr:M48 family metallopeptidase [Bacteroidia bacterium]